MRPILYALAILLLSINFILGLPKAVDLIQTQVLAINTNFDQTKPPPRQETTSVAGAQNIPLAPKDQGLSAPPFSAISVLIQDLESGKLLFTKDPNKKVPIASTTKIMTALVAVSSFKPNEVFTVPDLSSISGSAMGLRSGEQLTFRSLLYGLLLNSGNDAAYTMAANFPGGALSFVEKMNQTAKELGLVDTHFNNSAGYDNPSHYSSAFDLAKIAALAVTDYQIARIVATRETSVASVDKTVIHQLKNLNKLLDVPGVKGIKTGTTPAAKENLIGLVERDNHQILTVVLGSDDRFNETQKLIDWTFTNFIWSPH